MTEGKKIGSTICREAEIYVGPHLVRMALVEAWEEGKPGVRYRIDMETEGKTQRATLPAVGGAKGGLAVAQRTFLDWCHALVHYDELLESLESEQEPAP